MPIINNSSEGQMFYHTNILHAYRLARDFSAFAGHVATMPEIIAARAVSHEGSPVWNRYLTSSSGEFYGRSKAGNLIVVVAHGIDGMLNDEQIMVHSTRNLRENKLIQLTGQQFRSIEEGEYGEVAILDLSAVVRMREFPSSVLSFGQAMEEPLLRARLGPSIGAFLESHRDITQNESGNDYVITNDHRYLYVRERDLYTGGLLHIGQLMNERRWGDEPNSVSSLVKVADLSCAGRFISVPDAGQLRNVGEGLDLVLSNIGVNWQRLSVPYTGQTLPLYTLMQIGGEIFARYEKKGARVDSHLPKFHVRSIQPVGGQMQFQTTEDAPPRYFRYDIAEIQAIAPAGANSYIMGQPEFIREGDQSVTAIAPVQFYVAEVDTRRRILQPSEVRDDTNLVRSLVQEVMEIS